jgi:hypothetical protein
MIEKDVEEDENLMQYYMRTRAREYFQFYNRLAGILWGALFLRNQTLRDKQSMGANPKVHNKHIVLSIVLMLSILTGISMTGLLNDNNATHVFETEIHSGFWGVIPLNSSMIRTYIVENPTEFPVNLELKTRSWIPSEAPIYVNIAWNYDDTPLLPGEAIEISITLENLSMDGTIFVSFDIYVQGMSTLNGS